MCKINMILYEVLLDIVFSYSGLTTVETDEFDYELKKYILLKNRTHKDAVNMKYSTYCKHCVTNDNKYGWCKCKVVFPKGLNKLYWFRSMEVKPLEGLKILIFGKTFNKPLKLPKSLKEISFGTLFDQPIILPEGLEKVVFGSDFNQQLKLPKSLKEIRFGSCFNQSIILPEGLKLIEFGCIFKQKVKLPDNLETVIIDSCNCYLYNNLKIPKKTQIVYGGVTKQYIITEGGAVFMHILNRGKNDITEWE